MPHRKASHPDADRPARTGRRRSAVVSRALGPRVRAQVARRLAEARCRASPDSSVRCLAPLRALRYAALEPVISSTRWTRSAPTAGAVRGAARCTRPAQNHSSAPYLDVELDSSGPSSGYCERRRDDSGAVARPMEVIADGYTRTRRPRSRALLWPRQRSGGLTRGRGRDRGDALTDLHRVPRERVSPARGERGTILRKTRRVSPPMQWTAGARELDTVRTRSPAEFFVREAASDCRPRLATGLAVNVTDATCSCRGKRATGARSSSSRDLGDVMQESAQTR